MLSTLRLADKLTMWKKPMPYEVKAIMRTIKKIL